MVGFSHTKLRSEFEFNIAQPRRGIPINNTLVVIIGEEEEKEKVCRLNFSAMELSNFQSPPKWL